MGPAVPPTEKSALEPTTATDTKDGSATLPEPASSVEPSSTAESPPSPIGSLTAKLIAERVVSAPVDNEGTLPSPILKLIASEPESKGVPETTSAANETNVSRAPKAESTSTSPIQPTEPVAGRIAPSIPSGQTRPPEEPTSKTTVTAGHSKAQEPKSEGKVSSWLKTKFRRTSKPAKPTEASKEPSTLSESVPPPQREKGFIGGATLAAASNTSVNRSGTGDSEREVAMAGKPSTTPAAAATTPPTVASAHSEAEDLYGASPAAAVHPRRSLSSSSISSLSSSEGETRGRTRLPREPKPMQHNLRQSLRGEHPVGVVSAGGAETVDPVPAATGTGRNLDRESSDEEVGDQFEEARDTFDGEALEPPKALTEGRGSDSPVRDSKFSEDL